MSDELTAAFADGLNSLRETLGIFESEIGAAPWTAVEREALECIKEDIVSAIRWTNWLRGRKPILSQEATA
jgi:hypothetical protein